MSATRLVHLRIVTGEEGREHRVMYHFIHIAFEQSNYMFLTVCLNFSVLCLCMTCN